MGRGSTSLDNYEYDRYLASNKKERELRERRQERQKASKDYDGWHFGIDPKGPVRTRNKEEFRKALDNRGLMMESDVKNAKSIIKQGKQSFGGM